jgi:sugar O-acyltransferase (sialic acid O-acetyltransferase NeuD family)
MQRIAIAGSQELCARLIHYFESTHFGSVVGLFDDFVSAGEQRYGRPVLGDTAMITGLFGERAFDSLAIGIGYRHLAFRGELAERLAAEGVPLTTFVHPTATVDPTAQLAPGALVLTGCTVEMQARIGPNVFLSPRCFVSHGVDLGAHTYCAPAVALAGHTRVGQRCFLGIGTVTVDGIVIGDDARTAAGAVITREVPAGVMVAGVPAVIKRRPAG